MSKKNQIYIQSVEQYGAFPSGWTVRYKTGANKYQPEDFMNVDEFLCWHPEFSREIEELKRKGSPYPGDPKVKSLFDICQEMTEEYYGKKD